MSAGAGLLGPVRLGDAERVSQSRDAGFQVELGGLGQVGLLAEVVQTEERGAALHLGLDQRGRGDLEGAKGLVDFSLCLLTFMDSTRTIRFSAHSCLLLACS